MTGAQILDAVIAGNLQSEPFRDEAREEVARLRAVVEAAREVVRPLTSMVDAYEGVQQERIAAMRATLDTRPDAGEE